MPSAAPPLLADVVAAVEALYPPGGAASWDAIGLVCGDPQAPITRILLAVDPATVVVDEAIEWGASLLLTHHPLFLRGIHGVAATTPKGRMVHRLITAGIGLHVAHTNADHARPGVSDALAEALGLRDLVPLDPQPAPPLDKVVVFVPEASTEVVLDAMAGAGAGAIGDYDRCSWRTSGIGTFRPGEAANPAIGQPGAVEAVAEHRLEMVLPRGRRHAVLAAMRAAHPYEEVAYDLLELAAEPGSTGTGRVGELPEPLTLSAFAEHVAAALPATSWGLRVAGDPDRVVRRVAVCGGSGDSLLGRVGQLDVDAYVTADLRHHPASDHLEAGGPALVDVAHWASEWPWLPVAAARLQAALAEQGYTVETRVSTTPTDPWTMHRFASDSASGPDLTEEGSSR